MRIRHAKDSEKIELQMTSMIDIVFLLLTFFIMTFKIVPLEGDFNIKMPASAPSDGAPDEDQLPPMKLRLAAGETGRLASIRLNDRDFRSLDDLHAFIIQQFGTDAGPSDSLQSIEIELDCDYRLKYENVVAAITAISGQVADDGSIIKLVQKIRFAPPKNASPPSD